jgi:hypothetical protein
MKFSGTHYTAFEPVPTSKAGNVSATQRRALLEAKSIWPSTCGLVLNPYPLMG